MVFNPKREGWEMPGGKVEREESDEEAIEREFSEETGHRLIIKGRLDLEDGAVFTGEIGEAVGPGEMDWCAFPQLPEKLSFPRVEYLPLIEWARKVRRTHVGPEGEGASA